MVSSPSGEKRVSTWENSSSVKRKRDQATRAAAEEEEEQRKVMLKCSKEKAEEPLVDIELQHQTPLPLEWQQCLDLKSGEIHFYNIRTHKRTNRDPRQKNLVSITSSSILSLDLELNLHKKSPQSSLDIHKREPLSSKDSHHRATTNGLSASQLPSSRLSPDEDYQEMVPIVCARCHMLVMLCKSTPTCPNCKFLHPSNLDPLKVFLSKSQPLAL